MSSAEIPVAIASGFMGAVKTSLVNHLLIDNQHYGIGVGVNEFDKVGSDGEFIVSEQEALIEINAGRVCRRVRADLLVRGNEMLALAPDDLQAQFRLASLLVNAVFWMALGGLSGRSYSRQREAALEGSSPAISLR